MKNDLLFQIRKTHTCLRAVLLALGLLLLASPSFATIRYVDDARPDNNGDGLSWATALKDLKLAISVAQAGDEIWVAQGTYKPTTNPAQTTASFSMKEGVAIYGGFTSGQANRNDRNPDPATNNTILSGDIDNDGLPTGNSRNVIYNASPLTPAAILDGFTITHGNSNAAYGGGMYNENSSPKIVNCRFIGNSAQTGGGMYNISTTGNVCSPTLVNCTFQNNSASFGGGMYNNARTGTSSPTLTNCAFITNTSASGGGAMYNDASSNMGGNSSPVLTNCRFSGNATTGSNTFGGAVYNVVNAASGTSDPIFTNCSFQSNTSTGFGAAVFNFGGQSGVSSPAFTNCSFQSNSSSSNNGTLVNYSIAGSRSVPLINCVFFDNGGSNTIRNLVGGTATASYSLFESSVTGYLDGGNNQTTSLNPFVSTTSTELRMGSPAIDAGNSATNSTCTDLAGNVRKLNTIDLGAYEFGAALPYSAALGGTATISAGGTANLSVVLGGGAAPYTVTYVPNGGSNTPVSGYTSGANIPVSPNVTTTYRLVSVTDASGCAATLAGTPPGGSATVTVQAVPLVINNLTPPRNQRNALDNTFVAVTFDQPLANNAATKSALKVFSAQRGGRMQDGTGGTATVSGSTLTFDPTTDFKPGETIFTTVTTAAQTSGGASLASGQVQQFTTAVGGTGRGNFVVPSIGAEVPTGDSPYALAIGDVNDDGNLDLFTANTQAATVSLRLGNGSGGFSGTTEIPVAAPSRDLVLADVDGDGDLDLVVAAYGISYSSANSTVSIRLNDGSGNFSAPDLNAEISAEPRPNVVKMGDIDGDGDLDMVVTMFGANEPGVVLVRFNDGSGAFSGSQRLTVADDIHSLGLGDVDGDGDLDLLVGQSAYFSGIAQVGVFRNNGAGEFGTTATTFTAVGSLPVNLELADVDGDGDLDFVTANNGNSSLSLRLNDGTGTFAPPAAGDYAIVEAVNGLALGDIDADGDLDIVFTKVNSGKVAIWLNDGTGNFTAHPTNPNPAVGDGPFSVALGDIDGDGDLDFLTANTGNQNVSVRLNQAAVPNPVTVTGIVRANGANQLTNAASVDFTVTFSGSVSGLSASNFTVLTAGAVSGASVSNVAGSGSTYTVSVNTGTGDGSVQLQLANATGLTPGVSNVPFADQTYIIDKTRPTLSITSTAASPTTTSPISLTFTFSEDVTGFEANDVTVTNGTLDNFAGSGTTYTASVTPTAPGTVTVDVAANVAQDAATSGNTAATQFSIQYALPGPATRYVDITRPDDSGDGLSWATAHKYLQTALAAAQSGDQIWVAQGTYKPTTSTDRTISFVMKENVKIYGGFTSGQANLTDRNTDPATNNTILSGDINNDNALAGNSYHVILNINNGLTAEAVLDGFTITGGNGDGTGAQVYGGGMFCFNSSPTIIRCIFRANAVSSSGGFGGAVALQSNSSPLFVNCSFEANEAGRGGGVSSQSGSPKFTNCSFVGNSAPTDGGAFSTGTSSSPQLTNCSFLGNRANRGEAIINQNSSILLTNCVLFGNGNLNEKTIFNTNATVSANYCLIEAGETDYSGSNNLTTSVNPFVSNESTELSPCSPAIDAGDDAANNTTIDLAGNVRKVRTIDMGAYEYQGVYSPNQRTWIGAIDNNWNEPGNWSPACVPTVTDVVSINPAPNDPIISSGQSIEAGQVNVNQNAVLTVASGGNFTVRGGATFGLVLRGASFTNNGTVNIEPVSGGITLPLYLVGAPSNAVNNGQLRISTGNRSFLLSNASTFTNSSSGSIEILNGSVGISMSSDNGTINNYGTITYTGSSSAITLDVFTGNAFNNYGRITLNRSNQGNPSINIAVNNEFNNYACGKIVFTTGGGLTNNGTLTNAGLFIGGLSNSGTFTNTGVLDRSPSGAFTNQGIIVSRTTTYPNPIFTYGTGNDNVVNGIFADTTASTSAGTFSPPNDFTPNSATTRLFASISPAGGACSYIVPFFYTLPTFSFQGQPTVTNVSCNGGNDGSISVSASGAVGSITYALSPSNSQNGTGNFSNLMAGSNYIVTATDEANRTINTSTITITQPDAIAAPTLSASPGNTTTNQPITVSASGCAGTVSWNTTGGTDNNDGTYTFTDAGSYSISATCTVGGCVSPASQTLNLTINSCTLALGQPTVSNLTCFESGDGAIALTATGGSGSLTYTLSPSNVQNATGSFSGLSAGSYTVSVTDASQCSATSGSISLTQPAAVPAPTLSANPGTTTTNQPITVSASGCAGTLSWNTSGGTDNNDGTYTFSAVGNYTISATCTVEDCTSPASDQLSLSIGSCALALNAPSVTNLSCFESGDGAIALTATGGAGSLTYTLSPGNVQNATGSFSGLSAGTYTVSVTDASQCSATSASIQVTQPAAVPAPTLSADPGITTTNQPITVSASGCAGTVNWNTSGGTDNNDGTYTFTDAGSYSVSATCTVDGCTSPASQTLNLTINACALALGQPTVTNLTCFESGDGAIALTATGGAGSLTYTLSPGSGQNATGSFSGLSAGTYTVSVSDANNCTATSASIQVTQPAAVPAPTLSANPGNTTTNQPITVSASGCAGTVSWNTTGGTDNNDGTYTFSAAGSYSVSATCTVDGCTSPASQTLNLTINACALALGQPTVTNLTCFNSGDGAITIGSTGGSGALTYTLNPGNVQNATGSFTGLSAGSYTVSVSDANSCAATSGAIQVTQPGAVNAPTLSASPGSTTTNQPITVSASGCAGTVSWTATGGTDNNDGTYTFSAAGSYSVSATCTVGGCMSPASQTLNLTINDCALALGTPSVTNLTCFESGDGAIALTATGGAGTLAYTLSPGNGQNATGSFTGLSAGTYTVSVSDANQCSATSGAIAVTQPDAVPAPTLSADPGTTTTNQPITVSASGCSGTVSWTAGGGTGVANGNQYTFSTPGSYTLSATCTVDGCTSPASEAMMLTINECPTITLNIDSRTDVACFGASSGSFTVTATGGAAPYAYSIGGQSQGNGAFTDLPAGTYSVMVTDANGCTGSTSVDLSQPATALSVQASGNTSVIYGYGSSCTTLTASASGGKPGYTYAWNNGTQGPTLNVCPTQTTTYTVTVTDANQCVATRQVTVTVTDVRCGSTGGGILMCANGRETCVAQYLVATYLRFGYQLGPCSTGNTRQAADEPGGADLSLSLTAYPNPTSGQVTVQVQGAVPGQARFELVNAQGRAVQQQAHRLSEGHNEVPLELGAQPAGNYLIRCIDALGRQAVVRINRQ